MTSCLGSGEEMEGRWEGSYQGNVEGVVLESNLKKNPLRGILVRGLGEQGGREMGDWRGRGRVRRAAVLGARRAGEVKSGWGLTRDG